MPGQRLAVLWLIKGLGPGGAERLLVSAAAHVDRERFRYEVCYLLPWKDHLAPDLEAAGVPVTCLEVRRPWDVRWGTRLRRLVRDRRIDVVHAHLPYAAIGARLALPGRPPAIVYTEHNTWDRYRPLTRRLNAATFRRNDAAIAVSDAVRRSIRASRPPVTVIPNGVDVEGLRRAALPRDQARAELGLPPDAFVVGTVGGISAKKGHRSLVRAASVVAERMPDAVFSFVGLPIDPEPIRREIAAAGLDGRVVLAGYRPDAARLMRAFDLYCLPSRFEGMPVSLLEAMALGLPSVATAVGGVPEVVTPDEDAVLVPPDDPRALGAALLMLAGDVALRERMGGRAAATAERFGMAETVRRTEAVYLAVTGRTGG